jgi:hypothetical protein
MYHRGLKELAEGNILSRKNQINVVFLLLGGD